MYIQYVHKLSRWKRPFKVMNLEGSEGKFRPNPGSYQYDKVFYDYLLAWLSWSSSRRTADIQLVQLFTHLSTCGNKPMKVNMHYNNIIVCSQSEISHHTQTRHISLLPQVHRRVNNWSNRMSTVTHREHTWHGTLLTWRPQRECW